MGCSTSRGSKTLDTTSTSQQRPPKNAESSQDIKPALVDTPQLNESATSNNVSGAVPMSHDAPHVSHDAPDKSHNAPEVSHDALDISHGPSIVPIPVCTEIPSKGDENEVAIKDPDKEDDLSQCRKESIVTSDIEKECHVYNETKSVQSDPEPEGSNFNLSVDFEVDPSYNIGTDKDTWSDSSNRRQDDGHGQSERSSNSHEQCW